MTYIIAEEHYGRKEQKVDHAALAKDLAPLIGGTYVDPMDVENSRWYSEIRIGEMMLHVATARGNWRNPNRFVISAHPLGIRNDDRPWHGNDKAKLPDITVSAERPVEAIAKDVKRRVIDASRDPIEYIKSHAAQQQSCRDQLAQACAEVERTFPGASKGQNGNDKSEARYWLQDKPPLTVYADGTVYFDRLRAPSVAIAKQIVDLLSAK